MMFTFKGKISIIYREVIFLDVQVGDKIIMKKNHPCGNKEFLVLRVGMDFKLRCVGCGHEMMIPRSKAEKNIKKLIRKEEENV